MQKNEVKMGKPLVILNPLYRKRINCMLLELHNERPTSNVRCDEIVQKWSKADDNTCDVFLRTVKSVLISINCEIYKPKK